MRGTLAKTKNFKFGSSKKLARMEMQKGVNRKDTNKGLEKAYSSLGLLDRAGTVLDTFTNIISWHTGDGGGQMRPKQGPSLPGLTLCPAVCPDGSDFWKSVNFTDYSQHSQMVMAPTLRCPVKLEASLCQRQDGNTLCEDLPNATARESEGVRQAYPGPGWAGLGPRALIPD